LNQDKPTAKGVRVRTRAARSLIAVIHDHLPLDEAILQHNENLTLKDKALHQALCYGVMRWHLQLLAWLKILSSRPLHQIDPPVQVLILLGLQQLAHMRTPAHAAIHATVESALALKCSHAKGMINAVLRNFLRRQTRLAAAITHDPVAHSAHPRWMLEMLQQDWPHDWQAIVVANNEQAAMSLRVDTRQVARDEYLQRLAEKGITASAHAVAAQAVTLESAIDVDQLPGFSSGCVSVQDAAAQLAAPLLQHDHSHRVLDACAAPGGKTAHILQLAAPAQIDALDVSASRLQMLRPLFERIGIGARRLEGDAAHPDGWWDEKPYDRILLDAPCSASGVIRRHPDIKHHRSQKSIRQIARRQQQILDALWPLLRPGGIMLYVTCSVFKIENEYQIAAFIKRTADAKLLNISVNWGRGDIGKQILPGEQGMDGFYFARLGKKPLPG